MAARVQSRTVRRRFPKVTPFNISAATITLSISARIENEVDGMTLINDEFDDDTIRRLIPIIKHQVAFKDARKKLRFVNLQTLYTHTVVRFFMNRAKPSQMQETSQVESLTNTVDTVRDTIKDMSCKHRKLRLKLRDCNHVTRVLVSNGS